MFRRLWWIACIVYCIVLTFSTLPMCTSFTSDCVETLAVMLSSTSVNSCNRNNALFGILTKPVLLIVTHTSETEEALITSGPLTASDSASLDTATLTQCTCCSQCALCALGVTRVLGEEHSVTRCDCSCCESCCVGDEEDGLGVQSSWMLLCEIGGSGVKLLGSQG